MVIGFNQLDKQRMAAGQLSSTQREVVTACYLMTTCMKTAPHAVKDGTLLCVTDNQGAAANINKMRGNLEMVAAIRPTMQLAAELNVDIKVIWQPRETPTMQRADALSRVEDAADFALAPTLTSSLTNQWGTPTGDAFAGIHTEFHKAAAFFTSTPAPLGLGCNALSQDWKVLGDLVWVFPPVWLIEDAILRVAHFKCNSILVLPSFKRVEWHLLENLPIKSHQHIHPRPGMFLLGSKVPANMQNPEFTCALDCFLVRFAE